MLKREIYLSKIREFYNSDLIKILVGIRRCGKSVILKQIIDELKETIDEDHIVAINFEFIDFNDLLDYKKLHEYIETKIVDNNKYYIFCDEIQNVENFELAINSLRAKYNNISIFITGSNSKLLSNELSTVLSGRYVTFNIYPLCYKEYIEITNSNYKNDKVFENYLKWGGLPNVLEFKEEESIRNYLQGVFDSIILRDVVDRLNLSDITLFNQILEYLIDTTGKEFSAENIIMYLKNNGRDVSTKTLYSYVDALSKALIIKKVHRYDIHGKALLKTLNKYYMTDLGISQLRNNNFEINKTMCLENVVYNELLVRGYRVYIGKTKKGEIDFVAEKNNKREYYQVSYKLKDEKVISREFSAFDSLEKNDVKFLLTLDKNDFSNNDVIHKKLVNWLME